MWVTNLQSVCENPGQTFERPCGPATGLPSREMWTATLGCAPDYRTWGALGLVHVFDEIIVPEGSYVMQAVNMSCDAGLEGSFSEPLPVSTTLWGDIGGPFDGSTGRWSPPDGSVDVPFDAIALLDKFANRVGAPIKVRADLQPALPDLIIDILDVVFVLDAFRGLPYPFEPGPGPCP